MVVAELALLDVLRDGVVGLLGGHLHLGPGVLGDLGDEVEQVAVLEGDVVPRRHRAGTLGEEQAVTLGAGLALLSGGDGASGEETRGTGDGRSQGSGAYQAHEHHRSLGKHETMSCGGAGWSGSKQYAEGGREDFAALKDFSRKSEALTTHHIHDRAEGVELSTGGVELSTGGVELSTGGVELSTGGVELSHGSLTMQTLRARNHFIEFSRWGQ